MSLSLLLFWRKRNHSGICTSRSLKATKKADRIIMGSIRIYKGMPPLTEEQIQRLDALKNREIDYSDIPPLTDAELKKFKPARLREKNKKNIAS